jgi:phage shock protein A
MKPVFYWLLGDRAARLLVATWNWLWSIPVEKGGKVAMRSAEVSVQEMQQQVAQLTQAVAQVQGAYTHARRQLEQKLEEQRAAEAQAQLAQANGNSAAARMAMTRAIVVERSLPALHTQVQRAEAFAQAHQAKLDRERQKLEAYKIEVQNLKAITEVNDALRSIASISREFDIGSAQGSFADAKTAIERENLKAEAIADLADNPTERLQTELDALTLDEEITRRLQSLKPSPSEEASSRWCPPSSNQP